jgi:hypothetical protein
VSPTGIVDPAWVAWSLIAIAFAVLVADILAVPWIRARRAAEREAERARVEAESRVTASSYRAHYEWTDADGKAHRSEVTPEGLLRGLDEGRCFACRGRGYIPAPLAWAVNRVVRCEACVGRGTVPQYGPRGEQR